MALLPEGFALPPLPYLVALLAGAVAVGIGFARTRPVVGEAHVLALVPWMVLGAALHVGYVLDAVAPAVRPLFGTPAVYVTVAVVAGGAWVTLAARGVDASRPLAATGSVLALLAVGGVLAVGAGRGGLAPLWPGGALLASLVLGPLSWAGLRRLYPPVAATGRLGLAAMVGHALDGTSTAVGVEVLGFGERTPLSRLVIETGQALVGSGGWLFVVVKLLVAGLVVAALADYVREEPREGYPLVGLVAAVGLGPGVHNLLLFTVA